MKPAHILCGLLLTIIVLPAAQASASSVIELIGGDPNTFPVAPSPTVYFTPDPAQQLPPPPQPVPNPLPVPSPRPGSRLTWDRLQDAPLPGAGSFATVPIKVSDFYLSGGPVVVGSSFFDVFFTLDLDPSLPSLGQMTITRGSGLEPGMGTFDSFFDVFMEVHFEPVPGNPGTPFDLKTHDHFTAIGTWAGVPLGGGLERFAIDAPFMASGNHGSVLYLEPVPEPVTMAGLCCGLAGLGLYVRKRREA